MPIRLIVNGAKINAFTCPHCQFQWDENQFDIHFPKGVDLRSGWNLFICKQCDNMVPLFITTNNFGVKSFKVIQR